jgi:hypothetical protein
MIHGIQASRRMEIMADGQNKKTDLPYFLDRGAFLLPDMPRVPCFQPHFTTAENGVRYARPSFRHPASGIPYPASSHHRIPHRRTPGFDGTKKGVAVNHSLFGNTKAGSTISTDDGGRPNQNQRGREASGEKVREQRHHQRCCLQNGSDQHQQMLN